jgi:hypothetical protein
MAAASGTVALIATLSVGVGSVQWVEALAPPPVDPGSEIGDSGTTSVDPRTRDAEPRTPNVNTATRSREPRTGNADLPSTPLAVPSPEGSLMSESPVARPQPVIEATPISILDPPSIAPAGADGRQPSPRSPWEAVAAGGVAVGRASADAGEATAGFLTRAAQRIAGAF